MKTSWELMSASMCIPGYPQSHVVGPQMPRQHAICLRCNRTLVYMRDEQLGFFGWVSEIFILSEWP